MFAVSLIVPPGWPEGLALVRIPGG